MAPPQQAGKFKPRKPAKKIQVGLPGAATAATSATSTTAATAATSSAAQPMSVGSSSLSGRGSGRGRGRGGRGGRGMPVQQGEAFFTATAAPSKSSRGGTTKAAVARRLQAAQEPRPEGKAALDESVMPQEEIVGILDEAIGGPDGLVKSSGEPRILDRENLAASDQQQDKKGPKFAEDEKGYTYDSDSSREESRMGYDHRRDFPAKTEQPLQLPFPPCPSLPGIGHHYVPPKKYSAMDPMSEIFSLDDAELHSIRPLPVPSHVTENTHSRNVDNSTNTNPRSSPFADVSEKRALEQEKQNWFLVQFPTRLPPLRSAFQEEDSEMRNENLDTNPDGERAAVTGAEDGFATDQPPPTTAKFDMAEVATPPVRVDCFDNSMSAAVSGRMGKIQIYNSGKTVLVLTAADGTQVKLNVTQGISCSFQQQAAIIDMEQSNLVMLGKVGKTLIVTPNLDASPT